MNKFWELTPIKFLSITLLSHISLLWIIITGSWIHISLSIVISILMMLLVSVPFYHRYLSHKSWNPPEWYKVVASFLGVFCFTGSTLSRTVIHRQHHAFVDTDRDPHSPFNVRWIKIYFPYFNQIKINLLLARDLTTDPMHRFIHYYYILIIVSVFCVLWILLGFTWAVSLSIAPGALCWMNVCMLNIFGHTAYCGSNSRLLNLLTLGEGNHKYHHAHPNDPNSGRHSFDPAYLIIKLLNKK